MQIRPLRWLALAAILGGPASAWAVEPLAADQFTDPLRDYRRLELVVAPGTTVNCEGRRPRVKCIFNTAPNDLGRVLAPMEGSPLGRLEMMLVQGDARGISFDLAPGVEMRTALFDGPRRWVVELGRSETLAAAVEDEQPFRPYPLPDFTFKPPLPPPMLPLLAPDDPDVEEMTPCQEAWRRRAPVATLINCEALANRRKNSPARRLARILQAEARQLLGRRRPRGMKAEPLALFDRAEAAARDPLVAVRYTVIAAQWLARRGRIELGIDRLDQREKRYAGTPAEPWWWAARATLLIESKDLAPAESLLARLAEARTLGGDGDEIRGRAMLGLAALAYQRGKWDEALAHHDVLSRRWPGLLMESPSALFRFAEVSLHAGRTKQARTLYEHFLARYPRTSPYWICKLRLIDLTAWRDPEAADQAYEDMLTAVPQTEGRNLAVLHQARLSNRPEMKRRALNTVMRLAQTDYVRGEVLAETARMSFAHGRLREAWTRLGRLRTLLPDDPLLKEAPWLSHRLLYLLMSNYERHDRSLRALSLFYGHRDRITQHPRRGRIHLIMGRILSRLAMEEEALSVLQAGLSPQTEAREKKAVAEIYLEMAGVLRRTGDAFRLGRVLDYLDRGYPDQFDNLEYWLARGARATLEGRSEKARDIYRFAINGPVGAEARTRLAEELGRVYETLEDWPQASKAWRAVVDFHDEAGGHKDHPRRRAALWRVAELEFDHQRWPFAVAALANYAEAHPGDERGHEASWMMARSLLGLGDIRTAAETLDRLSRDIPEDAYTRLAKQELEVLKWRRGVGQKVLKKAELAGGPEAAPAPPAGESTP